MKTLLKNHTAPAKNRGVAAVEVALTAPILFMFIFASIEFARANMVASTAENAAFEAARVATLPGGTSSTARQKAREVMQAVDAEQVTVRVRPNNILDTTKRVTVTVEVPMDSNGFISAKFFQGKTIIRKSTMTREQVTN